jgi:hypothetical protein
MPGTLDLAFCEHIFGRLGQLLAESGCLFLENATGATVAGKAENFHGVW